MDYYDEDGFGSRIADSIINQSYGCPSLECDEDTRFSEDEEKLILRLAEISSEIRNMKDKKVLKSLQQWNKNKVLLKYINSVYILVIQDSNMKTFVEFVQDKKVPQDFLNLVNELFNYVNSEIKSKNYKTKMTLNKEKVKTGTLSGNESVAYRFYITTPEINKRLDVLHVFFTKGNRTTVYTDVYIQINTDRIEDIFKKYGKSILGKENIKISKSKFSNSVSGKKMVGTEIVMQ